MPEEEPIERAREDEREGKSPSTQAGQEANETPSQAGPRQGPQRRPQKNFAHAFPCYKRCAQTREPSGGIEKGVVTTRETDGSSTFSAFTFGRSEESRPYTQTSSSLRWLR